jgi:hypothetical protein
MRKQLAGPESSNARRLCVIPIQLEVHSGYWPTAIHNSLVYPILNPDKDIFDDLSPTART